MATYSDKRYLEKTVRVISSVRTREQSVVALRYLRLVRRRVYLGTTKDLLDRWINYYHLIGIF